MSLNFINPMRGAGGVPRVSVVIPTFNSEGTLEACLKSLNRQSFRDFEVLLIDGGSKDRTLEIARKYSVRVYFEPGLKAAVRNLGIEKSRGGLIAFIDSDEIASPSWLENLVKRSATADIVLGNVGTWNRQNTVAYLVGLRVLLDYASKQKQISTNSLYSFPAWNLLMHKDLLDRVGKFDTSQITEDGEFSYRAIKKGVRIAYAPDALTFHKHPASLLDYYRKQKFYAQITKLLSKKYSVYRIHYLEVILHAFSPLPFIEIIRAKNSDLRRVLIPVICWLRGAAFLLSYFSDCSIPPPANLKMVKGK